MRPIMDLEIAALLRALDAPTGENAGDLDHVALVVAAVHAERMELEQLTGVVLVDPPRRALAHGVRRDPIARRGEQGRTAAEQRAGLESHHRRRRSSRRDTLQAND